MGELGTKVRTGRLILKDCVKNPLAELDCSPSSPHNSATHLVYELHNMRGC